MMIPISIRRAGPDFRFPNGARIGIVFNLAYEAWSPGKAPPIGPMGNVLQPGFFDTNAHSWASYGAVRGIQRLLRICAANKIKTSAMVSGVLAERFPDSVRAIRDAGHEIVAPLLRHGRHPGLSRRGGADRQHPPQHGADRGSRRHPPHRLDQPARHRQPGEPAPAGLRRLPMARRLQRR